MAKIARMRRLWAIFFVAGALGILARAEDGAVQWGAPVKGLRIGVSRASTTVVTTENPTFTVTAQNVSGQAMAIPTPETFVEVAHPDSDDYHETPLSPIIRDTGKTAVAPGPSPTYTYGSEEGKAVKRWPTRVEMLAPGQSATWEAVPLEKNCYFGDRLPPDEKTTVQHYYLKPGRSYEVRFQFANEQAKVCGKAVWTGTAVSGVFAVTATGATAAGTKLTGEFSLPKDRYFLGEPIMVTFKVTNGGKSAVEFPSGGDSRATGRHDRFAITAVDGGGKAVPDPVKAGGMGGGLGCDILLQPGETHTEEVMANHYCAFAAPGIYTITCKRVLNIEPSDKGPGEFSPEEALPTVPIESQLKVTLVDDPAALKSYLDHLALFWRGTQGSPETSADEALLCLALAKNEAAFSMMAGLLDGPPNAQGAAVECLGYYPPERAVPVLANHFSKLSQAAKEEALGSFKESPTPLAEPLVAACLRDPDARIRADAVDACWRDQYPGCVPILLGMGHDPDSLVRRYVAGALGDSKDARAVPVILKLLHDRDVETRYFAAFALNQFGRKEGVAAMIEELRDPKAQDYKSNVIYTLTQLTGKNLGENPKKWLSWWEAEGKKKYAEGGQ